MAGPAIEAVEEPSLGPDGFSGEREFFLPLDPEETFLRLQAQRVGGMTSSVIRDILLYARDPDMLYFAGGLPAHETFPDKPTFLEIMGKAADRCGAMLQYNETPGMPDFLSVLALYAQEQGYILPAEDPESSIVVTVGSQQALDHINKLFINPGDIVVVDRPTYLGELQAANQYGAVYLQVPSDEEGMLPDALEAILREDRKGANRIKYIYVGPSNANPTGITLSAERRQAIAELLPRYGVFLVADEPYEELTYEGEKEKPMQAYNPDWIIGLKTLSKTAFPGLRIGYLIAPRFIRDTVAKIQQATNLHASSLAQAFGQVYIEDGYLARQLPRSVMLYTERRDTMLAALSSSMPEGMSWTRPKGGLFCWAKLPEGMDAAVVLQDALKEKVAFVPGVPFFAYPLPGDEALFRLSFSNKKPAHIEEGMRRLGGVIELHQQQGAIFQRER